MKHFQSKIEFAQIETKVGEDDHWLGTATESWGEVAFNFFVIGTFLFTITSFSTIFVTSSL